MVERGRPPGRSRPSDDDEYFEELTRAVLQDGHASPALEARWPSVRRSFSNFSVRAVADYAPEDVDRLMADPAIRRVQKIEATIENAAEMLLIEIEYGSFREYADSFELAEAMAEDVVRRFRQLSPSAALAFARRVSGAASAA